MVIELAKSDILIKIKTIHVEGEIFAYGKSSILRRKLTCYNGSKGVLYYADDRFFCTREEVGVIWKAFGKLPKFAYTKKGIELPLKDIIAAFEKRKIDRRKVSGERQSALAEQFNGELEDVIKQVKKIV